MPSDAELRLRERLGRLRNLRLLGRTGVDAEVGRLERQLERMKAEPATDEVWRSVELARHEERPYTLDYVDRMLEDFVELHGDRARADDAALVAGLGRFDGRTVAVIGHQKARDLRERQRRNFGMAHPEGYRKAIRVMELADRHHFPLLTFVDTPGAYPGLAAEQHGQGGAIARSQAAMARLEVPAVASIIGEGGSGGAIALALADRVLMQRERHLLGHLARGVRRDPLARPGSEREGRRGVQAGRDALSPARRRRRRRAGAPVRGRTRTTTVPRACLQSRSGSRWRISRAYRATSSSAAAAAVSARSASTPCIPEFTLSTGLSPAPEANLGEAHRVPAQARSEANARAVRRGRERLCAELRHPAPRRQAPALRPPARARRCACELGRAEGHAARAGRAAPGGACRGSSARVRNVRR